MSDPRRPAVPDSPVVLDTNVFVAAGFNPGSRAAELLRRVRDGRVRLAWDAATRAETRRILERIPRLDWADAAPLFDGGIEIAAPPDHPAFALIGDPADRKFAALALAAGAVLVSNDSDLLSVRENLPLQVLTPSEYVAAWPAPGFA